VSVPSITLSFDGISLVVFPARTAKASDDDNLASDADPPGVKTTCGSSLMTMGALEPTDVAPWAVLDAPCSPQAARRTVKPMRQPTRGTVAFISVPIVVRQKRLDIAAR
jgi:hypothetical protein